MHDHEPLAAFGDPVNAEPPVLRAWRLAAEAGGYGADVEDQSHPRDGRAVKVTGGWSGHVVHGFDEVPDDFYVPGVGELELNPSHV
ncbi:MAG: hypothetical protein M1546_14315 [Chloroflexi bacterium]|nr:hypothetical protein [Chloroflexota bacterium]